MAGNHSVTNIWKDKGIAPFEYCSLPRAAKLLKCEIEDFYHWHDIKAITLAVDLIDRIPATVYFSSDSELSDSEQKKILLAIANSNNLGASVAWGGAEESYISIPTSDEHGFHYVAYPLTVTGVWEVSHNRYLTSELDNKNKLSLIHTTPVKIKIPSVTSIIAALKTELHYNLQSLLILRSDIENLYEHAKTGAVLPSYINGEIERPAQPIADGSTTQRPSDKMKALITILAKCAGFDLDQPAKTAAAIEAAAQKQGYKIPISQGTLSRWRNDGVEALQQYRIPDENASDSTKPA
ncbi:hypothetical protein H4F33_05175 [Pectobacterium brasiliense]|uniref:hypothetical protein n=1 Tax=Pectobacterium brasiliense TaxID=180957 RepID=UPI0015DFE1DB|nr:hypothetical protein [Pectobacterium brasiliense]MBA0217990.1 hypothetical protein [Pectobacterium brasiliense]MBN3071520.1 hypothetical protein [Pectobacterium brasiliense]